MAEPDARGEAFVLAVMDLDAAQIGRGDGGYVITRGLAQDDTTGRLDCDDILEAAREHGLAVENVTADFDAGEVRVWIPTGAEGS